MKSFLRQFLIITIAVISLIMPQDGFSEEWDLNEKPWEKFGFNFGAFISTLDSSFRIGSGIGLDIDVEDLLGLDSSTLAFRTDAMWRFSKNRRHRIDFTWFSIHRDGNRQLLEDITIGDIDDQITIPAGTTVEAFFDLDIYELAYSYSFFQDDRIDLSAGIGLYIMPMSFGINATGLIEHEGTQKFTAPLPVFGLRMDIALTPDWFIRTGTQVFYLEYDNFTGSVLDFHAALEYNPWEHVGIGLGFDTLGVRLEADGEDYPGVDLNGTVDFNYAGIQLYVRVFY